VRRLIAAGADVNCQNADRDTPLLCAIDVVHHNPSAAAEIVQMLANAGADLEIRGYMDKTPFLKGCSRGDLPLVKLLVRLGADVKAVVDDGGRLDGSDFAEIFQASSELQAYVHGLCRADA
jgi:ankyrin repeat protein